MTSISVAPAMIFWSNRASFVGPKVFVRVLGLYPGGFWENIEPLISFAPYVAHEFGEFFMLLIIPSIFFQPPSHDFFSGFPCFSFLLDEFIEAQEKGSGDFGPVVSFFKAFVIGGDGAEDTAESCEAVFIEWGDGDIIF